jgi:hypothetical protein
MSKYDTELTNLVKDEIKRKGLVDSGKLLGSIKVTSNVVGDGISIDIQAEDYFQYLDAKYSILSDVMNSNAWVYVIGQMTEEIALQWLETNLKDIEPI